MKPASSGRKHRRRSRRQEAGGNSKPRIPGTARAAHRAAAAGRNDVVSAIHVHAAGRPGEVLRRNAAQLPRRFGTKTMRAAKRPEYTLEEKRRIFGEIPYTVSVFPIGSEDRCKMAVEGRF